MDGWRRCGVDIRKGILVIKKNEILPLAKARMELENIMLSERSQSGNVPYDFIHMWNLRNKIKKKKRQTKKNGLLTTKNNQMVTRREMGGGMGEIGKAD